LSAVSALFLFVLFFGCSDSAIKRLYFIISVAVKNFARPSVQSTCAGDGYRAVQLYPCRFVVTLVNEENISVAGNHRASVSGVLTHSDIMCIPVLFYYYY